MITVVRTAYTLEARVSLTVFGWLGGFLYFLLLRVQGPQAMIDALNAELRKHGFQVQYGSRSSAVTARDEALAALVAAAKTTPPTEMN